MTYNVINVIFIVIMKYLIQDMKNIERVAGDQRGVFSIGDLTVLLNCEGRQLYNRLNYLLKNGILKKATRGFYTCIEFDIQTLAARINPESYISGATVLGESLVIGTVSKYELNCIKTGRSRKYRVGEYYITYNSINRDMFFGYEFINGVKKALPEKAFLDCLYYYQSGQKYYFNIFEDINIGLLDEERLFSFLSKYKNPKFRKFVYDYYSERS